MVRSGGRLTYSLTEFAFYVDEVRAWGVTTALQALNLYPKGEQSQRQLGKAVHTAVELFIQYDLPPSAHSPRVQSRLKQFLKFLDRERVIPVAYEVFAHAFIDAIPIIAISDLVVVTPANTLRVIDIKSGSDTYPNNLQTAAQQLTLQHIGLDVTERMVLSLHEDSYERSFHRRARDFDDLAKLVTKLGPRPQKYPYETELRAS